MARSLRSRQPLLKHPKDQCIIETKSKKSRAKNFADIDDATENSSRPNKVIVAGTKSRLAKGNLDTGWRMIESMRSPVLQDRTNLPREPLKVDLLIKKGMDDGGATKKSTQTTRKTAKPANLEEKNDDITKKTTSTAGIRKNSHKVTSEDLSSSKTHDSEKDVNKNKKLVDSEAGKSFFTIGKRVGKRAVSRRILPKKLVESNDNSSPQNIPDNDKVVESSADTRSNAIGTRLSKRSGLKKILSKKSDEGEKKSSLREIPENDEAEQPEAKTRSNAIGMRGGARDRSKKILSKKSDEVEKKSLLQDIAENDESSESENETPTRAIGRRIVKRSIMKKTSLQKKSVENVKRKSSPRTSRIKVIDDNATTASGTRTIRKFFKGKVTVDDESINSPIKKTVNAKRRNIGSRQKVRMSTSFRLKQMTLSESFANQSTKKRLRPRQTARNYCEDSVISDKRTGKDNEENVDPDKATKKVGPVYKIAKFSNNSDKDKNEIYEFDFDSNDSREKMRKKTRKRTVRKNVLTKKVKAAGSAPKKVTSSELRATTKTTKVMKKINDKPDVVERVSTELDVPTNPREMEFEAAPSNAMEHEDIHVNAKNDLIVPAVGKQDLKNAGTSSVKPIIIQSVELRGNERLRLTSTPQLGKSSEMNSRAFNTKNSVRSSLQYRTMVNHALLTKSLSPITKAMENFDPGSPWRPPTFANQQFSRIKNVVQSTPHLRKFAEMLDKADVQPESKNEKKTTRNDIVSNVPQVFDRISPKKAITLAKSPRKFGTEISNVHKGPVIAMRVSNAINNDISGENRVSPQKSVIPSTSENETSNGQEQRTNSFEDDIDDKENCTPSPGQSPLKSPSKSPLKSLQKSPLKSPKKLVSKPKPLRALSTISFLSKENVEPQAGPSNVQKPLFDDSRILRQTNLDNFLNLDEMPKSTRIVTAHGIFDDAHSTPICGKPIRKINKEANIENAFGFDEYDESSMDISPIKRFIPPSQISKNSALTKEPKTREVKTECTAPARLSIGDIKKHLLPIAKKPKVNEAPIVERIEKEENENENNREKGAIPKNRIIPDPVTFTDTFDVMEDTSKSCCKKVEEIPLFEDIEPAHFKQAPRYSYKRKRPVPLIFSEDEEQNESPTSPENRGTKKRKISKVERERQKQMENWANSLNNTFDEIDHFDLIVE